MPKTPIDFSKTIIYKISKDNDFYVGSTTDFPSRKYKHKSNCSNEKSTEYRFKLYQTIRDKGGWDSWEMTPLEEYVDCKSQIQARIREEEWRVKLNAILNTKRAYTSKEQRKEDLANYDKIHADKIKEQQKQRYIDNADKIKEQQKTYYKKYADEYKAYNSQEVQCECGAIIRKDGESRHKKTLKHQINMVKK